VDNVRVLVVADDALARAGLATLLSSQAGCTVVGQVGGDSDLVQAVQVYHPDVAIWDLGMTPAVSLERLDGFRDGGVPVVALVPDETAASDAWSAGARGVLLRNAQAGPLVSALKVVAEGLAVFGPELASTLLPARTRSHETPAEELTPRELQVLQLLAEGQPNKEIARRLGISEHTVKFHVNAILGKLNVQSRTEAVVRATRLGLVLL
jgi:DNA-binding NarL/FixJ family response regulator